MNAGRAGFAVTPGLAGCASPDVSQFAGTAPEFEAITTAHQGEVDGPDSLHKVQRLAKEAEHQSRDWHMLWVTPTHFEVVEYFRHG